MEKVANQVYLLTPDQRRGLGRGAAPPPGARPARRLTPRLRPPRCLDLLICLHRLRPAALPARPASARIVLSWFPLAAERRDGGASSAFLFAITEPVLAPAAADPPAGAHGGMALDLSPIIVFFGIDHPARLLLQLTRGRLGPARDRPRGLAVSGTIRRHGRNSPAPDRCEVLGASARGYDPDEVDNFLERVSAAVAQLPGQAAPGHRAGRGGRRPAGRGPAAAGRGRGRARRVEAAAAAPAGARPAADEELTKVLVLAQRTADQAVEEANAHRHHARVADARAKAVNLLAEAEQERDRMLAKARKKADAAAEERARELHEQVTDARGRPRPTCRPTSTPSTRYLDERARPAPAPARRARRASLDDPDGAAPAAAARAQRDRRCPSRRRRAPSADARARGRPAAADAARRRTSPTPRRRPTRPSRRRRRRRPSTARSARRAGPTAGGVGRRRRGAERRSTSRRRRRPAPSRGGRRRADADRPRRPSGLFGEAESRRSTTARRPSCSTPSADARRRRRWASPTTAADAAMRAFFER